MIASRLRQEIIATMLGFAALLAFVAVVSALFGRFSDSEERRKKFYIYAAIVGFLSLATVVQHVRIFGEL